MKLQRAGWKLKKSWNNVLRYAFLKRTEASTSQLWYKCAHETKGTKRSPGQKAKRVIAGSRVLLTLFSSLHKERANV